MEQQDILLPDSLKDIAVRGKFRSLLGSCILFLLQVIKPEKPVHFHQEGQVQRAVNFVNFLLGYVQLLFDNGKKPLVNALLHFQADHLPPLPSF